ncbi:MAG: hypothetical protein CM15mP124_3010 [Alphaproteobacteria bacterium]|nr:MAG: hypothetical protein CM15mP124_3010 [Alphaproteobacteria bacterium]
MQEYNKKLILSEETLIDLNNKSSEAQSFLNDLDKKLFIMNNIKSTLDEEIKNIKEELLKSEKNFKLKKEKVQKFRS